MKNKSLVALLLLALMLCQFAVLASASDTDTVNAEIDLAYGGAAGIVSMTFDDGYYETAVLLNELFEKYDLKGTLMIIGENSSSGKTGYLSQSSGRDIFAAGRLEPQSHSMSHVRLTAGDVPTATESQVYEYEMVKSKEVIESLYPGYDILTFGIPHGTMGPNATAVAQKHYFASRTNVAGVQSLDPGFTTAYGSWAAMYSPATYRLRSIQGSYTDDQQWELVKSDIDKAANGWYIPLTHRVGDVDGTDMSYKVADKMFSYIASLRDEGKVWVSTYSEAVKYVRERQNTTLVAKKVGDNISLTATLAETTADGLTLNKDVFDYPLTVKVEVESDCDTVYYLDGCTQKSATAFTEGGRRYVRVEIVPNGEELTLYSQEQSEDTYPHDYLDATCNAPKTCKVCGYTTGTPLEHDFAEATCTAPKTCILCNLTEGEPLEHDYSEATCATPKTCTMCKKTLGKPLPHYYIPATCTEPKTCRDCGTQTGSPLGHNNDETTCMDTKCTRCDQIIPSLISHSFTPATCTEAKTCTACGLVEGEALGHTVGGDTCAKIMCGRCKTLVQGDKPHDFDEATCTKPKTCKLCFAVSGTAIGHTCVYESTGAADSHKTTCSVCLEVINEAEPHADGNSDGLCDDCNAAVSTEKKPDGNNTVTIIVIVSCGVVVAAGAATFIIIRKKRAR